MQLTYKKATLSDLNEIFSIVQKAIIKMESQNIFQWDELYPDKSILKEDIEKSQLYCVYEQNQKNQIAAFFVLNSDCDEEYKNGTWANPDSDFIVIHRLCVNVDFQKLGIATKIMEHVEQIAITENKKSIRLDCFTQNPYSQKLYYNLGFKNVGFAHWRKGEFLLMEKVIATLCSQ